MGCVLLDGATGQLFPPRLSLLSPQSSGRAVGQIQSGPGRAGVHGGAAETGEGEEEGGDVGLLHQPDGGGVPPGD